MPKSDELFISRLCELVRLATENVLVVSISVLVGVVLGSVIAIQNPPLYEGSATVKIGHVGSVGMKIPEEYNLGGDSVEIGNAYYYGLEPGFRMLVTSEELYRELAIKYNHRRAKRGLTDPPYVSEMNNQGDALQIIVKGESSIQTKKYLDNVVNDVLSDHEILYKSLKDATEKIHNQLIKQIGVAIDGCSRIQETQGKQEILQEDCLE